MRLVSLGAAFLSAEVRGGWAAGPPGHVGPASSSSVSTGSAYQFLIYRHLLSLVLLAPSSSSAGALKTGVREGSTSHHLAWRMRLGCSSSRLLWASWQSRFLRLGSKVPFVYFTYEPPPPRLRSATTPRSALPLPLPHATWHMHILLPLPLPFFL
jgi:hypothetical protein